MNYPEKFKQGFIKQIEKELNKCEIIYNPNTKGIWFVNREKKYWYLEYKVETNYLWWRYDFFKLYTNLFYMDSKVFEKVISEWVENKLNGKVETTLEGAVLPESVVEETLNCKVLTTRRNISRKHQRVEETLNLKVLRTMKGYYPNKEKVEVTLNCKVDSTWSLLDDCEDEVEETLICKVLSTKKRTSDYTKWMEDTLNLEKRGQILPLLKEQE